MQSWPLPSTKNEKPCRRRFPRSFGSTTSASCPSLGVTAMSLAQPRTMRTTTTRRIRLSKPQVSGFHSFESLSMCCSITQLSANFISTSANAIGRSFRGHGCGICCSGSGFLGPQSSGVIVGAVHSFPARCLSTHTTPLVPPQTVRSPQCQRCGKPLGPGSAASTTPLAIRFTNFAGGVVNFAAAYTAAGSGACALALRRIRWRCGARLLRWRCYRCILDAVASTSGPPGAHASSKSAISSASSSSRSRGSGCFMAVSCCCTSFSKMRRHLLIGEVFVPCRNKWLVSQAPTNRGG